MQTVHPAPDSSREALLRAGKQLFARNGLDGTTVRDIASQAGVNLCLISYHFGGKEGLYRACLEQYGRERLQVFEKLATPAKSAEEFKVKLKLLLDSFYEGHTREPELILLLIREVEAGLPVARDIFESTFLVNMRRFNEFFKSAQKSGYIRAGIDPLYITSMIFGTFSQLIHLRTVARDYFQRSVDSEKEKEKLLNTVWTVLCDGSLQS